MGFWKKIELPGGADDSYVCIGVKASNYFMPKETLSEKGPGGGGWIIMNKNLQVETRAGAVWGDGVVFAVGDCNYGCIESTKINECKDEWIGILIWHFVHHTPVHLFGKGRFIP